MGLTSTLLDYKIVLFFFNQNDKLLLNEEDTSLHLKGSLQSGSGRHVSKSFSCLIFPLTSSVLKRSARVPIVTSNFPHELVTIFF